MILALDIGLNTGYCIGNSNSVMEYGLKKFTNDPSKTNKFYSFLLEKAPECDYIFYEEPVFGHFVAVRSHSHFEAMLWYYSVMHDKKLVALKPKSIKKFATGSGNASKDKMVEAVKNKGYDVSNDNVADAIMIYYYAMIELSIYG